MPSQGWLNVIRNGEVHTMSHYGFLRTSYLGSAHSSQKTQIYWVKIAGFQQTGELPLPSKMWPDKSQLGSCAWNKLSVEFFTLDNII